MTDGLEALLRALIREELEAARVPVLALTVDQAAASLAISPGMVRKLVRTKRLRAFRVGNLTRISLDELRAYQQRHMDGVA